MNPNRYREYMARLKWCGEQARADRQLMRLEERCTKIRAKINERSMSTTVTPQGLRDAFRPDLPSGVVEVSK